MSVLSEVPLPLPRFVGCLASDSVFLGDEVDRETASSLPGKRLALLLGEPGSGKSTVARILDSLGDQHVLEDLREHSEATLESRIVEVLRQQPTVLILDSLDEWSGAMSRLAGIVRRRILPALASGLNLVATCRTGDVNAALLDVFRAADKSVGGTGQDDSFTFYLLPLRRTDAEAFIEGRGLDSSKVLSKLTDFDAEALAANVGLLDLVCTTIEFDDGVLESREDLFASAVARALDLTVTDAAQAGSTAEPSKLIRIAQLAAGVTLLGGKSAVRVEGLCRPSEFPFEDLLSGWGSEAATLLDDTRFVLASPLFTQFGPGARTFSHKSIASYLTARFLQASGLGAEQVVSLVMTPPESDVDPAVIPQLRETCAWLLVLDPNRFGWLVDHDAYSLSRYGALIASPAVKSRIVKGLLDSADDLIFKMNWSDSFAGLNHDSLGEQLNEALGANEEPRAIVALRILRDAYVVGLEDRLLSLATDPTTTFNARVDAVRLLIREEQAELLVEHTEFLLGVDQNHEILGALIEGLWPKFWSTAELLGNLAKPDEHYFGSYMMALKSLPDAISLVDTAEILEWANSQITLRMDENSRWLAELSQSILKRTTLAEALEIGKPAMDAYWLVMRAHKSLPLTLTGNDPDQVLSLIRALVQERPTPENGIFFLAYAHDLDKVPVLHSASDDWLQDQAERSNGATRRAWLLLLRNRLNPLLNATLERVWSLRDTPGWDLFAHWFEAVEIDSQLAEDMKESAKARADLASYAKENAEEDRFIASKLSEASEVCKTNPERFWELAYWLDAGGPEIGTDLLESKNVPMLGEGAQSRILDGAAAYLDSLSVQPLPEFERGLHSRPLYTACRAATTLLAHAPERLTEMDEGTWDALVVPVFTYPYHYVNPEVSAESVHEVVALLAEVVDVASLIATFEALLNLHDAAEERFPGLELAKHFTGDEWASFVARQFETVGPNNFEALSELAFKLAPEPALARCELVVRESSNPAQISEAVLLISNHLPSVAGGLFLELCERDLELAKSVTLALAPARRWQGTVLGGEPVQLARIYEKLRALFPPEDDPSKFGFHTVTPAEDAGELRDSLLSSLIEAGTSEAVQSIRTLQREHAEWGLQSSWVRARERLYQSAWSPVDTPDLRRLVAEQHARVIRSAVELRRVAMETLGVLQSWLSGEIPQAFALWNAPSIPGKPKDENSVSDWYCHGLRLLLNGRNVVVNREVEVTRGTGAGMGSRNDIRLDAVGDDGVLSVVVEVKGCWNPKLRDGVQNQLDVRYLTQAGLTHGIFLVVCFPPNQIVNPSTHTKHTLDGLRSRVDGYLASVKNDIVVVVHDATLPELLGRADSLSFRVGD